jgi:hypothetical protein
MSEIDRVNTKQLFRPSSCQEKGPLETRRYIYGDMIKVLGN